MLNLLKFFPIDQFGCLITSEILVFFNLFTDVFKKGPPEAVKYIFEINFLSLLINDQTEKCSESIGIKFVLYFFRFFFINFQPQIIDSLLALAKVLVKGITFIVVGSKPSNPEIPIITKSNFFLFIFKKSAIFLNILIFLFKII